MHREKTITFTNHGFEEETNDSITVYRDGDGEVWFIAILLSSHGFKFESKHIKYCMSYFIEIIKERWKKVMIIKLLVKSSMILTVSFV